MSPRKKELYREISEVIRAVNENFPFVFANAEANPWPEQRDVIFAFDIVPILTKLSLQVIFDTCIRNQIIGIYMRAKTYCMTLNACLLIS